MPADRYIVTPSGVRYDRQTGWAEYQGPDGQWVRASDDQNGPGSRRDDRLRGSAGMVPTNHGAQTQDAWNQTMQGANMDLFRQTQINVGGGDAGDQFITGYELTPEAQARLGNRQQIPQLGTGGYEELRDPSSVEWDDEFGFVTDPANIREASTRALDDWMPYIVAAGFGGIVAGAAGAGGAGAEAGLGLDALETFTAANPGWEAAYQAAATAAPETAYGLDALESVPFDQGVPFEQSPIPEMSDIFPEGMPQDGTFNDPLNPWTPESAPTGNPFSPQQIARGLNTARSLFGGGGEGQGQGGQGGGIMGGFGAAPRIGDHRKDDDPFGLKASGWGPWSGLVKEDPKQKVAQALMERNPWSYQG